jgi:hypothetical protein
VVTSSGLVYSDANVNANSANLIAAAKLGDIGSVHRIIASGCDINKRGMWGNTPIIVSCQYNHPGVCRLLLSQPGIDVSVANEKGVTALLCACLEGMDTHIIRDLIAKGAYLKPKEAMIYNCLTDKTGLYSPLSAAIVNGHISVVDELMQYGLFNGNEFLINPLDKSNPPIRVPSAMLACIFSKFEVLRMLVSKHGASLHGIDSSGNTLLHRVSQTDGKCIDALVECIEELGGFDCNHTEKMIDAQNETGDTPLMLAANSSMPSLVRKLLDYGANPNLSNKQGITALHNAIKRRSDVVAVLLLKAGADIRLHDNKGISPLDAALKLKADAPIRVVIEQQAGVSATASAIDLNANSTSEHIPNVTSVSTTNTNTTSSSSDQYSRDRSVLPATSGFMLPTCPSVGAIALTHEILHAPANEQPKSDPKYRKYDQTRGESIRSSIETTPLDQNTQDEILNDSPFREDEVQVQPAMMSDNMMSNNKMATTPARHHPSSSQFSEGRPDMATDGTSQNGPAKSSTLGVYDASSTLRFVMPHSHEDFLPSPVVLFK